MISRVKYQITIWDFVRWDLFLQPLTSSSAQSSPPQFARGAGKGTKTQQLRRCSILAAKIFLYSWGRGGGGIDITLLSEG